MFNIEKEINKWKKTLRKNPSLEDGYIDELVSHLRDDIDKYVRDGLLEDEAFNKATNKIGEIQQMGSEYFKSNTTNKISCRPSWQAPRWIPVLFWNYYRVAIRNLKRNKGFTAINITGLTLGLTCSLLILLWVNNELSYDTFHDNAEDIYRVVKDHSYSGKVLPVAVTPAPLGPALKESYPEIIDAARIKYYTRTIKNDDELYSETLLYADPSVLKMFTFPLINGDENTALKESHSIILSESLAEKIFGDENPTGKHLLIDNKISLVVTGVLADVPENSHLQFNAIVPFVLYEEDGMDLENWRSSAFYTYVRLHADAEQLIVNEKIKEIINNNRSDAQMRVYLQAMLDIHLYTGSRFAADIPGHGNIELVNIFTLVSIFIILIACINFMNLSTARSVKRAKEVSLRKILGGVRSQLIWQFFIESILLTSISTFLSVILVYLVMPGFNSLTGKEIDIAQIDRNLLLALIAVPLVTGIISGSYPALFLSSFSPAKILQGRFTSGKSGSYFRKVLVVTQFTISLVLMIGTLVVYNQLKFIQSKDLGFQKENILHTQIDETIKSKINVVKQELQKNAEVLSVTLSSDLPVYYGGYGTSDVEWEGKNPADKIVMNFVRVDEDYLSTFQTELKEGRFFSRDFFADTSSVVINESAVALMDMGETIGKKITMWGDELTIIGVTKDIHFQKLDSKSGPLVYRLMSDWSNTLFIHMADGNISNTINFIEKTLKDLGSEKPFNYSFLEEDIFELYESEYRMEELFKYFSLLAIVVSCLGLFGLASSMAERKVKEIGIRKTLGAGVASLTILLSKGFAKLVVLSIMIASPLAWYLMNNWLNNYAYKIEMKLWYFIICGVLALLVALFTVSFQTIKAALVNPVRSLKNE